MGCVRKKVELIGLHIDALSMFETIEVIDKAIQSNSQIHHTVVNAGKIVLMHNDPELYRSVVNADLINADGQSIVWLSRLCRKEHRLPERVAGIDLMSNLVHLAHEKGYKIFFLGAEQSVVEKVVESYSRNYSKDLIAGYRNGYFSSEQEPEVARQIAESGAQMLFVAMTSPKKENFLYRNRSALASLNFTMGVGGSFDVVAGLVRRAPKIWQKMGCEWLFRFMQEPRRLGKRYIVYNAQFMWISLRYLFSRNFQLNSQSEPRTV